MGPVNVIEINYGYLTFETRYWDKRSVRWIRLTLSMHSLEVYKSFAQGPMPHMTGIPCFTKPPAEGHKDETVSKGISHWLAIFFKASIC